MDSDGNRLLGFGTAAIIIFVIIKAFFTVCESAVTEINDARVKEFENEKGKKKLLYTLLSKPSRLITAFSVNRILTAVIISFISATVFAERLTQFIYSFRYPPMMSFYDRGWWNFSFCVSVVTVIFLSVLVMTVFCDRIPKRIAAKVNSEEFAVAVAFPVRILCIILSPLTALSSVITSGLSLLFGLGNGDEKDVATEEEILMMVDARNETGELEESQKEMISNIFEFDDTPVSEVMTHRTDIDAVGIGDKISDVVKLAISSGRSRIPVYEDTIDSVLGFICVKDLLGLVGCESVESFEIKSFLREALFVPGTNSCGEVFKLLTSKKAQLAVVVDEYGGTAGLITMEDLLESIVGNIQDEYDNDTEEIIKVSDNVYTIDGTAEPEHILEQLGVKLPEGHEYDTVGGLIIDILGRIPDENENASVVYQNVEFTVLVTEDKRISKIKAVLLPENKEHKNENKGEEL